MNDSLSTVSYKCITTSFLTLLFYRIDQRTWVLHCVTSDSASDQSASFTCKRCRNCCHCIAFNPAVSIKIASWTAMPAGNQFCPAMQANTGPGSLIATDRATFCGGGLRAAR